MYINSLPLHTKTKIIVNVNLNSLYNIQCVYLYSTLYISFLHIYPFTHALPTTTLCTISQQYPFSPMPKMLKLYLQYYSE